MPKYIRGIQEWMIKGPRWNFKSEGNEFMKSCKIIIHNSQIHYTISRYLNKPKTACLSICLRCQLSQSSAKRFRWPASSSRWPLRRPRGEVWWGPGARSRFQSVKQIVYTCGVNHHRGKHPLISHSTAAAIPPAETGVYPRCVQDVYNYLSPVPTGFRALQRREVIQCLTPSNDTVFAPIVIVDANGVWNDANFLSPMADMLLWCSSNAKLPTSNQ